MGKNVLWNNSTFITLRIGIIIIYLFNYRALASGAFSVTVYRFILIPKNQKLMLCQGVSFDTVRSL